MIKYQYLINICMYDFILYTFLCIIDDSKILNVLEMLWL